MQAGTRAWSRTNCRPALHAANVYAVNLANVLQGPSVLLHGRLANQAPAVLVLHSQSKRYGKV